MQREMVATATARMIRLIAMPMMVAVGRVVVVPDEEADVWDAEGVT
jgi:hypothetical protein